MYCGAPQPVSCRDILAQEVCAAGWGEGMSTALQHSGDWEPHAPLEEGERGCLMMGSLGLATHTYPNHGQDTMGCERLRVRCTPHCRTEQQLLAPSAMPVPPRLGDLGSLF